MWLDTAHGLDNKRRAELVMRDIDRLPRQWRELVHEFGWKLVCAARESELSYEETLAFLVSNQEKAQMTWLSTDFIPKGTRLFRRAA